MLLDPSKSHQPMEVADQAISRGHAVEDQGRFAIALDCYRESVAVAPSYPRAHLNVGNALRLLRRYPEAVVAFQEALKHDPGYAHAHFNLGTLLAELGDREGAKAALHEALRLQPDLVGKVLDAESYLLFSSTYRDIVDPRSAASEHFRVGAAITSAAGMPFAEWPNSPDSDRRLRVAYVSGDFGFHPVTLFLRPVLERHDPGRFDVFCYSNADPRGDPITATLRSLVGGWREIFAEDDRCVAERIRSDGIDILVDLSGHTEKNRLGVFARHPAPVQATWLGYLNTSGLPAMDYRICDGNTDPPGATEDLHTERLFRLPHAQWCYSPWVEVPLVTQPHAGSPDSVVFGSFNQFLKISDACLDLWAEVLDRIPEARIEILDVREQHMRESMLDRLGQRGVASDRVTLRGREGIVDYYTAIAKTDIALDTFPHNGGTTTLDALWMGVPMVALEGARGISRSSYSILKSLQMPDLIATAPESYVAINTRLARDADWRKQLRSTLRGRLARSPLMDAAAFVAALEDGYRRMWHDWCISRR
jgi:predicted O-linked N-acetylglucosamine transferase (SPINDLY family)